ncbi:hypothetical protein SDC9_126713 [bioreactor metagenome]|uniref:Uncharacterized protein n=1 Tax=bioreactor metagenome TaxID=1076179 RepID=A0A645CS00_9ZZZZ
MAHQPLCQHRLPRLQLRIAQLHLRVRPCQFKRARNIDAKLARMLRSLLHTLRHTNYKAYADALSCLQPDAAAHTHHRINRQRKRRDGQRAHKRLLKC